MDNEFLLPQKVCAVFSRVTITFYLFLGRTAGWCFWSLYQISFGWGEFWNNFQICSCMNLVLYCFFRRIRNTVFLTHFLTNVLFMQKPDGWFLLAKCLKNTCKRVTFWVKMQVDGLHIYLKWHSSTGVF